MNCHHPIYIEADVMDSDGVFNSQLIPVPCTKCSACLSNKMKGWLIRLSAEVEKSSSVLFITLTYNDECLPTTEVYNRCEDRNEIVNTFSKQDVSAFMKRLRDRLGFPGIKFFIAGEYGPQTLRPHYHGLLFNIPKQLFRKIEDEIEAAWQYGFVSCSRVTPARVGYVAKYINSFSNVPPHWPTPPICSSRNPAIGLCFLEKTDTISFIREQKRPVTHFVNKNGKIQTVGLPKYLKEKIFNKQELAEIREEYLKKRSESKLERLSRHIRDLEKSHIPGLYELPTFKELVRTHQDLLREEDWKHRHFDEQFRKRSKSARKGGVN